MNTNHAYCEVVIKVPRRGEEPESLWFNLRVLTILIKRASRDPFAAGED